METKEVKKFSELKFEELSRDRLKVMFRNEVVPIYVKMLQEQAHPDQVVRVNYLIIERWSVAGLIYIKEKAWQIYDPDGSKFLGRIEVTD